MPKFFIERSEIKEKEIIISGQMLKHITVLRHTIGDQLILCDGLGTDFYAQIISMTKNEIILKILNEEKSNSEPSVRTILYQALPKGDKSEIIIQKCTELGISKIVFFLSKRCISRPDHKTQKSKLERYRQIALSVAEQSGRGVIPEIAFLDSFEIALNELKNSQNAVMFYEGTGVIPLKQILNTQIIINEFSFMIGPEGGFDDSEVEAAREKAVTIGGLGKRILRTETASLCVLSAFMFHTDNLK